MANEEHVALLKQGTEVWNEWRQKNPSITPNLANTCLQEVFLDDNRTQAQRYQEAQALAWTLWEELDPPLGGHERGRFISGTTVQVGEHLIGANLSNVNFMGTDLTGANLRNTNLTGANLSSTLLHNVDFNKASMGQTLIVDVDLSQAQGLSTIMHRRPSSIGIDTIYKSGGNIPESFLRGAGVPETFITFMRSLTSQAFDFYSCFISHSSKDQEFVQRLYADLQSNGVRCWYAPEDLKIGEPFLLGIYQGIRLHDKLLLVLSEQSVNSGWVQQEVLSALAKEQGKEPWVLFPIRLDDTVMDTTVPWANMIRQSRHIGDFTRWKDHDSYKKAFERLLRDLKGKSSA